MQCELTKSAYNHYKFHLSLQESFWFVTNNLILNKWFQSDKKTRFWVSQTPFKGSCALVSLQLAVGVAVIVRVLSRNVPELFNIMPQIPLFVPQPVPLCSMFVPLVADQIPPAAARVPLNGHGISGFFAGNEPDRHKGVSINCINVTTRSIRRISLGKI
jgi:hypothetical protein